MPSFKAFDEQVIRARNPDTAGTMAAQSESCPDSTLWIITRAIVITSLGQCRLDLYVTDTGQLAPSTFELRDTSQAADLDVAEYPRGVLVRAGQAITAIWTSVTTGAIGVLRCQLEVYDTTVGSDLPDQYATVNKVLAGARGLISGGR